MSRVLVVEDHPIVALVMVALARAVYTGATVAWAGSVAEAIERAGPTGADVVLLDLGLPGCVGIEALTRIRAVYPAACVVVVSATEERAVVLAALEAGAAGYLLKSSTVKVMSAALKLIADGGVYVPPQALELGRAAAGPIGLTGRQLEVLRLLARGLANKEIAKNLGISKHTVKQHAKAVYAALGVSNRAQAGRAAQQRGVGLDP